MQQTDGRMVIHVAHDAAVSMPGHTGGDRRPGLHSAALSDVGRVRSHNEDAWLCDPPVYVVADGMGGHDAGDRASRAVIDSFTGLAAQESVSLDDLDRCVRSAQANVDGLAVGDRGAPGSTVVVAAMTEHDGLPFWLIANVGDSRAYCWSAAGLEQISKDHSVVQELIDAGEIDEVQARHHPERHVITRAIGALEDSVAEFALIPVTPGSRLLLCSDGLTSEVSDELIGGVLQSASGPAEAARELVNAALARGGQDNVTVVVVEVDGDAAATGDTLPGRSALVEDTVRTGRR